MELRLEDYARKEGSEWYEILRNHVKKLSEEKGIRIYIRPSSGFIKICHFTSTDPDTDTFILNEFDRSLRGNDCYITVEYWNELALNEPPWIFPAQPVVDFAKYLSLTPSFVLLDYIPKDDKEYYRFSIPEPVTIHLSNIWVEKKDPVPISEFNVPKIQTEFSISNLHNLFGAMVEQGWVEKGSEQLVLKRFSTSSLKEAVDPETPRFNWLQTIAVLRRLISRDNLNINNKLAIDHFMNKGKELKLSSLNSGGNITDKFPDPDVDLLCRTYLI